MSVTGDCQLNVARVKPWQARVRPIRRQQSPLETISAFLPYS